MHFKFRRLCSFLYEREKVLSVADLVSLQEKLQLNKFKHKHLPRRTDFSTRTLENQISPAHFLLKHETVLLSRKDDCHPFQYSFLGIYQFSLRNYNKGEQMINKTLD